MVSRLSRHSRRFVFETFRSGWKNEEKTVATAVRRRREKEDDVADAMYQQPVLTTHTSRTRRASRRDAREEDFSCE